MTALSIYELFVSFLWVLFHVSVVLLLLIAAASFLQEEI